MSSRPAWDVGLCLKNKHTQTATSKGEGHSSPRWSQRRWVAEWLRRSSHLFFPEIISHFNFAFNFFWNDNFTATFSLPFSAFRSSPISLIAFRFMAFKNKELLLHVYRCIFLNTPCPVHAIHVYVFGALWHWTVKGWALPWGDPPLQLPACSCLHSFLETVCYLKLMLFPLDVAYYRLGDK